MGSRMKKSIFDEQTSKALKKWHMAAKKKHGKGGKTPTRTLGGSASPASTGHTLHRFKTTGHSTRSSYTYEDPDMSDLEGEPLSPTSSTSLIIRVDHDQEEQAAETSESRQAKNEEDFSFVKLAPVKEP